MTLPADTDERNVLALDLLLSSYHGRPLPDPVVADREVEAAVAMADAFLDATAAPPADLDEAPDPDPHGLIEYAIAFAPTVHIGNAIVPVYLMEEADEAFRFQGRRAVLLGLAGMEFDNPDEAFDELRRVEAEQADNVDLGARLLAPARDNDEHDGGPAAKPIPDLWPTCAACGHLALGVACQLCKCEQHRGDGDPRGTKGPTLSAWKTDGSFRSRLDGDRKASLVYETSPHPEGNWLWRFSPGDQIQGRAATPEEAQRAADDAARSHGCSLAEDVTSSALASAHAATPLRDRIVAALDEGAAEFVACGYPHCSGDRGHMANAIERLLALPDVLALLLAQSEAKAQPPIADVAVDALSDRRF